MPVRARPRGVARVVGVQQVYAPADLPGPARWRRPGPRRLRARGTCRSRSQSSTSESAPLDRLPEAERGPRIGAPRRAIAPRRVLDVERHLRSRAARSCSPSGGSPRPRRPRHGRGGRSPPTAPTSAAASQVCCRIFREPCRMLFFGEGDVDQVGRVHVQRQLSTCAAARRRAAGAASSTPRAAEMKTCVAVRADGLRPRRAASPGATCAPPRLTRGAWASTSASPSWTAAVRSWWR